MARAPDLKKQDGPWRSSHQKRLLSSFKESRKPWRLFGLVAILSGCIYLLEGCMTLENHHSIELTSSASPRTPYLVNGKRARVVFGYYLLVPEGRQRLTVVCPTGKIEQVVEVVGEQYLFYDCHGMTMSLL
jgi:hypothetical protein